MARKTETQANFKTVSASISRELDKTITEQAKKTNRTKSEIIRAALTDYVTRK